MPLSAGSRLGPYEVLGVLGRGGMGEVYRARDPQLLRDVAIKRVPDAVADDPERRKRFQREARALAALNHPNVATLFGMERAEGHPFLVMELVEGRSLRQRLDEGPLDLDDALSIARQVAAALEAAHARGIVHRDLKPGNVMVRPDGQAKVLDFGLATAPAVDEEELSRLATRTDLSRLGEALGTAPYMSPEQLRGEPVDERTDVWAFGCLLYELLTGRKAFGGKSFADTASAVLTSEPSLAELPGALPPQVRELVRRCLRKDAAERPGSIAEAREVLSEDSSDGSAAVPPEPRRGLRPVLAVAGVAALVLAVILVAVYLWPEPPAPLRPVRPLTTFVGTEWTGSWSPDGSQIAFLHTDNGSADISVMSLGGGTRRLVAGGPHDELTPRWSPDGSKIAFLSDRGQGLEIFWVPPTGGPERRIASTGIPFLEQWMGVYSLGATPWSPDGRNLVFSRRQPTGEVALWRAEVGTGEASQLTDPPEDSADRDASWSPDGRWVAFSRYGLDRVGLWRIPAGGGEPEAVLVGDHSDRGPSWSPDGRRLVFFSDRSGAYNLWEIPLRGGRPRQLTAGAGPDYLPVVSHTGEVLFTRWGHQTDLYWLDLAAPAEDHRRLTFNTRENYAARVSPDGERIAYHSDRSGNYDIWLQDRNGGGERALTDHPAYDIMPDWSPAGDELVFLSDRDGVFRLWAVEADGTAVRRLSDMPVPLTGEYAEGVTFGGPRWSSDGDTIGFVAPGESGWTIWLLDPRTGELEPSPLKDVLRFDWYLDSRRVVYLKSEEGTGRVGLVAADLDTGEEVQLLDVPCAEIDVGPDGKAITFVEAQAHFGMNLHLLPLELPSPSGLPRAAGEPEPLTEGQGVWHVHGGGWAPDGRALVYTRDLDHGDLFVLETGSE